MSWAQERWLYPEKESRAGSTASEHAWQGWFCPSPEGSGTISRDWPAQLSPWHRSSALSCYSLTSTPSVAYWIMGRNWSWGTMRIGSPWLEQQLHWSGEVSVIVHYWWCTGSQRPWTWPTAHCTRTFAGGAVWAKGCVEWHTVSPSATRMNKVVIKSSERWSSGGFFFLRGGLFLN